MSSPSNSPSRKRGDYEPPNKKLVAVLVIAKLILAVVAFFGGKEVGFVEGLDFALASPSPDRAWFDCKSFDSDRYNWSHQIGIPHGNPIDGEGM